MDAAPELSIVIPTYNTATMTLACCRAAVAAAPPGCEVIVADDGSTDGTRELLSAEASEVRVVRLETNRRFAAAANAGVAAARGRIILLLNSDAHLERDALAALLAAFAADPRLGVAGARLLNADGTPQWSGGPLPALAWLLVVVSGCARFLPRRRPAPGGEVGWVSGAVMAFRRETWNAAGPLNEAFRFYAQDVEFCARAGANGWRVRVVEAARVVHDGGATMPRDPALLRLDLFDWGRAHYGRLWALAARPLMIAAAALRQLFVKRQELARERAGRVSRLDQPPAGVADRPRP